MESNLGKEPTGHINRMQKDIKTTIYSVIRQMLQDDEQSPMLAMLQLTIQWVQNLYTSWSHDIVAEPLQKITGYLTLSTYFQFMSYPTAIILNYIVIGIILVQVLLFLAMNKSAERIQVSLPMQVLRFMLHLLTTVLYMPIVDLFIGIVSCRDSGMHFQFDVECWVGSHIIHGITAIVFLCLFYIICIVVAYVYYESRFAYSNPNSKATSIDDIILKSYILIAVLAYSLMASDYIQILLQLFGAGLLYVFYYQKNTYNHIIMYKYWQIIIAVNMWTAIMLAFSRILEDVIFRGTIFAWLIGIPLIMLIILQNPDERLDLLLLDPTKATSKLIQQQCHHILRMFKHGGQLSTIIIDAYLKLHIQGCQRVDCGKTLLEVVKQNYQDAIKRFPYDCNLRIRYALFLYDFMNMRQQSLNELQQANSLSPQFDCEFIIFRCRKYIEEEMNDANMETMDIHNETVYQEMLKTFQGRIERTTLVHMDFWSQLQEDYPDLGRLSSLGFRIQSLVQQIEQMWLRMQSNKTNSQKALRIYGKFVTDVLLDADYGDALYEKSRVVIDTLRKGIQLIDRNEISNESLPTMIVTLAPDKFGQIVNLNLACCPLFGYFKNELINRKINLLIPNIYQRQHDSMIRQQNYDSKYYRERAVYVKCKSNYILPCNLELRTIQTNDLNVMLAAQFKLQKTFRQSCHILYDLDDVVDSISLSCVSLLGFDLKYIQNKKMQINELFPPLMGDREEYMSKQGCLMVIKPFRTEEMSEQMIPSNEVIELENKLNVLQFQATITEINYNEQCIGYLLRLDLIEHEALEIPKRVAKYNFQLRYNVNKQTIQGEYLNEHFSAVVDTSVIYEQSEQQTPRTKNSGMIQLFNQQADEQSHEQSNTNKANYGDGIRTLMLFQNKIQELDKDELQEDMEDQEQSIFVNRIQSKEEDDEFNSTTVLRSRQNLVEALNSQQEVPIITKLGYFSNLGFLFVLVLAYVQYFYVDYHHNQVIDNIDLIVLENKIHSRLQMILTGVQNLKMLNKGVYNITNASAFEIEQRKVIDDKLLDIRILNNKLLLSDLEISSKYDVLKNEDVIDMYFTLSTKQKYDFMSATQQIVSKAIEVSSLKLNEIVPEHPSVFFVEYNLLNQYWVSLRNVSDYLVQSLDDRTLELKSPLSILLGLSAAMYFIILIAYSISILIINQIQSNILHTFMDIPDKTVKYFYNKCENYISSIQMGEEQENISHDDADDDEKDLNKTLKSRKKKKKYINTNTSHKDYIMIFTMSVLVLEAYFVFIYMSNILIMQDINKQIPELNITSRCEAFYRMCDNAQRQLFYNRTYPLLGQEPYEVVKNNVKQMYSFDTSMQQQHALNVDVQNSIYRDIYDEVIMSDPCPLLATLGAVELTVCQAFARGAISQGMQIGIARYIENIRYIMTIYDKFYGVGDKINFTLIARGDAVAVKIVDNLEQNSILNLNGFNQTKESRIMQSIYFEPTFEYLVVHMVDGIGQDISNNQVINLALFILYNAIIFILHFIVWWPLLVKLRRNVVMTKMLIAMIPVKIIGRIKSIRQYIKAQSE